MEKVSEEAERVWVEKVWIERVETRRYEVENDDRTR